MRVLGEWKGLKWRNSKKSFAPRQRKAVLCMQGHSKAAAVAVAHKGGPPYPIQHKAISDLRSYPVSYVTAICFMQRRTQVNGSWFTLSSWKFSHGRTEIQKGMSIWGCRTEIWGQLWLTGHIVASELKSMQVYEFNCPLVAVKAPGTW